MRKNIIKNDGYALIYLLVIIFLFSIMMVPITSLLVTRMKVITSTVNREQALQIADAGINYYQWHLAHFPTDYQDGTGTGTGPYIHDYLDKDTGQILGQYSLVITPPAVGSTIVTITSTGYTTANPLIKRTVTARYGIPSLAKYAFLSNDIVWIGDTEAVTGELQSNNGIRFDGTTNAPVGSTKTTYTCSTYQGSPCPAVKNGVWGSASQAIQNLWQFPVPTVDFSTLTADLAGIKSSAQSAGIYLPPSSSNGYSLVFNSNGTVSVYKVSNLTSNTNGTDINRISRGNTDYRNRSFQYTRAIPANGLIYIEDNTWVEGTIKGKVLVAAAVLPYVASTAPSIFIPNNIVYAAKDGTNILGLLAQRDVITTHNTPTILEINAALIAQNGSVQNFNYGHVKNLITVYGSIMSYGQWTWSYSSGSTITSGYTNTSSIYDGTLLFGPPPSFPLSSSGYQQMDWTSN